MSFSQNNILNFANIYKLIKKFHFCYFFSNFLCFLIFFLLAALIFLSLLCISSSSYLAY